MPDRRPFSDFWTSDPSRVELLKELWERGPTAAAIGTELGCSKNAVVGKVHRLGLTPRRDNAPKPPRRDPFFGSTPFSCRWPTGHPEEPDFHFCCQPALIGKSYCAEHAARAFIRVPARTLAAMGLQL